MQRIMIITAAVAVLAATPSLAQNFVTPRNAVPMTSDPALVPGPYAGPSADYDTIYGAGADAFAAAPGPIGPMAQPWNGCGAYLGWDPDPNVRLQLLRDACVHQGD